MSRFFRSTFQGLTPYEPGEQPHGEEKLIKLNTNENPYPPSPKVLDSISRGDIENLRLYSDPSCAAFRAAMAEAYGVEVEQVLAGNGSDEVLAFAFGAFGEKGAAFPDLTYGFYKTAANFFHVPFQQVPLREDFSLAVEDYAGIKGMVVLANPNAPTGLHLPLAQIEELLRQEPDRVCLIDEAYVDFAGESAVALLPKYDNLLVVGTFSKSRCLAGARLGYAIGSKELIADLDAIRCSLTPYNINSLTLMMGTAAVESAAYYRECCAKIAATRDKTARSLRALGFTVTESKTNFLLAGRHPKISGEEYFRALRQNGVLVRYFETPRIADWVRISIGTDEEMQYVVEATEKILSGR